MKSLNDAPNEPTDRWDSKLARPLVLQDEPRAHAIVPTAKRVLQESWVMDQRGKWFVEVNVAIGESVDKFQCFTLPSRLALSSMPSRYAKEVTSSWWESKIATHFPVRISQRRIVLSWDPGSIQWKKHVQYQRTTLRFHQRKWVTEFPPHGQLMQQCKWI